MAERQATRRKRRTPLTRERVIAAAMEICDERGFAALTMRSLATKVGVEPMSLYHHVANRDDLIAGIVDTVIATIDVPDTSPDWAESMRTRARSARAALVPRAWVVPLLDAGAHPGPARMAHSNTVIGILRRSGFSPAMTARAFMLMDSFIYGFVMQETAFPGDGPEGNDAAAREMASELDMDAYPYVAEMMSIHLDGPRFDLNDLYDAGLNIVLEGLEAARLAADAD